MTLNLEKRQCCRKPTKPIEVYRDHTYNVSTAVLWEAARIIAKWLKIWSHSRIRTASACHLVQGLGHSEDRWRYAGSHHGGYGTAHPPCDPDLVPPDFQLIEEDNTKMKTQQRRQLCHMRVEAMQTGNYFLNDSCV